MSIHLVAGLLLLLRAQIVDGKPLDLCKLRFQLELFWTDLFF